MAKRRPQGKHAYRTKAQLRRMSRRGGRMAAFSALLPVPAVLAAQQPAAPPSEDLVAMSAVAVDGVGDTVLPRALPLDSTDAFGLQNHSLDGAEPSGPTASVTRVSGGSAPTAPKESSVTAQGIPEAALQAYRRAEATMSIADPSCRLSWGLLAGIGRIESDHGRYGGAILGRDGRSTPQILGVPLDGTGAVAAIADTDGGQLDGDRRWDRAVGPMQFIPSTWAMAGVDGDQDGERNPHDIDDAALAAAAYLCAGDEDLSTSEGAQEAVYSYNHSTEYVRTVLAVANAYETGTFTLPPLAPPTPGVTVGLGEPGVKLGNAESDGRRHRGHRKAERPSDRDGRNGHGAEDDNEDGTDQPQHRSGKPKHRSDRPETDPSQSPNPGKHRAPTGDGTQPRDRKDKAPETDETTPVTPTVPEADPQPEPTPVIETKTENGTLVFCDETQTTLCLQGSEDAPLAVDVATYAHLVGQPVTVLYHSEDEGVTWTFAELESTES
jgi:membrane-bound lytic murein transglycosylase B